MMIAFSLITQNVTVGMSALCQLQQALCISVGKWINEATLDILLCGSWSHICLADIVCAGYIMYLVNQLLQKSLAIELDNSNKNKTHTSNNY